MADGSTSPEGTGAALPADLAAAVALGGEKHPDALGRPGEEVWWDIWEPISPMLAGVMATGRATWSHDLMLALVSAGQPIERYFTFTYGPILAADGAVNGVFCAVTETTEKVLSERRLRLLTTLAGDLFQTRTVTDAAEAVARVCDGSHPDAPFVAVYASAAEGEGGLVAASAPVRGVLPEPLAAHAADRAATAACRTELRDWLTTLGIGGRLAHDVVVAVCEAVNNAVEHSSRSDRRQAVSVEVFADTEAIRASVTDPGRWAADATAVAPATAQGRGLTLIHGLSDSVEIVRNTRGTRLTMLFRRGSGTDPAAPREVTTPPR